MEEIKIFILLFLFLSATVGEASPGRVSAAKRRFELLCKAVSKVVGRPKFKWGMAWQNGGVVNDAFIQHLYQYHRVVYESHPSELGLRIKLGTALAREFGVFALQVRVKGRIVNKYFWGERPDLPVLVSEIISSPELRRQVAVGAWGLEYG